MWLPILDHYIVQECKYFRGVLWLLSSGQKSRRVRYIFDVSRNVHRDIYIYSKTNQMHNISNSFYFGTTLYMFRTVSPSIIRSLRLYIQHQVYVVQVLWLLASKQPHGRIWLCCLESVHYASVSDRWRLQSDLDV